MWDYIKKKNSSSLKIQESGPPRSHACGSMDISRWDRRPLCVPPWLSARLLQMTELWPWGVDSSAGLKSHSWVCNRLDKTFSLLRKCHLWFLHWPGVKPSDWYFWSQVLLWIASRIDWMGMSFFFFLNFSSVVQISLAFRKKCRQFWSELIGGMFLGIIINFHKFVYFKYFLKYSPKG